jgi:hypothetical protein
MSPDPGRPSKAASSTEPGLGPVDFPFPVWRARSASARGSVRWGGTSGWDTNGMKDRRYTYRTYCTSIYLKTARFLNFCMFVTWLILNHTSVRFDPSYWGSMHRFLLRAHVQSENTCISLAIAWSLRGYVENIKSTCYNSSSWVNVFKPCTE